MQASRSNDIQYVFPESGAAKSTHTHSCQRSSRHRIVVWAQLFARVLLSTVLLLSVSLFVGYWFAISLSAWWENGHIKEAARHFGFPFLDDRVAHRWGPLQRPVLC